MSLLRMAVAFIIFTLLVSVKHEFYVSITQIEVKADTMQVAIKIFTDDLEQGIENESHTKVFLDNYSDPDKVFKFVKDYCAPKISIGDASKPYEITWIGHEFIEDVTWVYGYSKIDNSSKILFVKNTLLMENNLDQHNMIQFTQSGKTSSQLCTREQPEVRFSIK